MLKINKLHIIAQQISFTQISQKEMEEIWGTGATYSVDSRGRITLITDSNGFSYDVVKAGTATHSVSGSLVVSSYTYEWNKVGSQIERGDYDLFKFLADHTDVEWGAFFSGGINASGSSNCYMVTNHKHNECNLGGIEFDRIENFDTFIHNHPKDLDKDLDDDDYLACEYLRMNLNYSYFGLYLSNNQRNGEGTAKDYTNDVLYYSH